MAQRESSSSFAFTYPYDIFLSFRGEDSRTGFTGHLYNALRQRGISTFMDDEGLERGEEIAPSLFRAIEGSRTAIIIFSQNYAGSSYCLDELAVILERTQEHSQRIWPIFYYVDPSYVRYQKGSYGEALAEHEQGKYKDNKEKVQRWRMALSTVANFSGWHFKHGGEYEHVTIRRIVEEVSGKLNQTLLHVANYPVGLEARMLEVQSLIEFDDKVNMLGIYGIGGMGKSTIARALYNLVSVQFEGSCFLADIREKSIKQGLVRIQETVLFELVGETNIKLGDVNQGIPILKRRLHNKRVLVVLDDVNRMEQLQAIAGGSDWFGPGSMIVITTRDKHLLHVHGVKKMYEVKEFNDTEALELFRWSAFKNEEVDPSYMEIIKRGIHYARGRPLVLETIGTNLFGRTLDEWKSALDAYERIPSRNIEEILGVSYDGLEEHQKEIYDRAVLDHPANAPTKSSQAPDFAETQNIKAPSPTSSSSFAFTYTYDVFLNFCGKDTRIGFTGHLYSTLLQRGFSTFMDDKGLERGEEIGPTLVNAIKKSRTAIIVFSENYASSSYCLDELVKILECAKVYGQLIQPLLHVANYPVGLEARMLEVQSLMDPEFDNKVKMLGIYGIGGMGKSTIARALYNLFAVKFEGSCFLADVREKSIKHGLVRIQETLLFELVGATNIKLGDVNQGIPILKRRLHNKRVLVVLDDVNRMEQLQAIAGGSDWFGPGSMIIITTRNKHLLDIHGVKKIYEVKEFNDTEALELISWNAFKNEEVDPRYLEIIKRAIHYAGGLPLVLETIGSNLFGKTLEEWKSALDAYERIPNRNVEEILVIYDGLEENQKEIYDRAVLDHPAKAPTKSSQAPGFAETQNIQAPDPTSSSGKVSGGEPHLKTMSIVSLSPTTIDESLRNQTELILDDVEMESFYASLDAGNNVLLRSHDKSDATAPREGAKEALKLVQDFISNDASVMLHPEQCSVMKTSLDYLSDLSADDGISGEMRKLISEASREFTHWSRDYIDASSKIESTTSELLRADELEAGLEDNKNQFREVVDKLNCMEESIKELEEQFNAIKANISASQSEKNVARQRKRDIFEEGKTLKTQIDKLREKVPHLKHEQDLAKKTQTKIKAEWSKLAEKFKKIAVE